MKFSLKAYINNPCCVKGMERLVHGRLVHYLETYELLSECQFGFRLKHSRLLWVAVQSLLSDCTYDMSKAFNTSS